jgi:hypothetical protein
MLGKVMASQLLSNAWESDGFATQHCQRGLGVSSEADEMDQMLVWKGKLEKMF